MNNSNHPVSFFEKISIVVTKATGTTAAFILALLIIIVWASLGPVFNYSAIWQLVINTATTILTFLMVFIIQRSQNKESLSIQLKLNELLGAVKGASVEMINIEKLSENDLSELMNRYETMLEKLKNRKDKTKISISVDDEHHDDELNSNKQA